MERRVYQKKNDHRLSTFTQIGKYTNNWYMLDVTIPALSSYLFCCITCMWLSGYLRHGKVYSVIIIKCKLLLKAKMRKEKAWIIKNMKHWCNSLQSNSFTLMRAQGKWNCNKNAVILLLHTAHIPNSNNHANYKHFSRHQFDIRIDFRLNNY